MSGVADVLLHVRRCWASGFSAHALAYRRRFGGASPVRAHDLAVGVLELVDARSAGVAFTLDPVTGDRGVCVVEGNWGFGESVVSGQVTPDHWTVDRASRAGADRADRREAGLGGLQPGRRPGGAVAAARTTWRGQACLSEDEVRYICAQAARIEDAAGGVPQDVEWAIARDLPFPDSVFFLQHRPETTWTAGQPRRRAAAGEHGPGAAAGGRGGRAGLRPRQVRAAQRLQGAGHMTGAILAAEVAEAAARAGGAVLMRFLRDDDELEIGYKDARANLVTAADRESQRAVTETILTAFPDHAIDGEEGTAGSLDAADVWYVDPLDGTTNFTHGLPFFCVSVALRSRGTTVAGAVYDPLHDEMFVAALAAARR